MSRILARKSASSQKSSPKKGQSRLVSNSNKKVVRSSSKSAKKTTTPSRSSQTLKHSRMKLKSKPKSKLNSASSASRSKSSPKRKVRKKVKQVTKQLVIPSASNDFRPFLIRRYGLALLLVVMLALQAGYNYFYNGQVLGRRADITKVQLLADTNEEREKYGQQPLVHNEQLAQAAYLKAQDMLAKQYWSHDAPDGSRPWKWINEAGYNYAEAGENLARGFNSTPAIISAWMNSPTHRENILKADFTEVGFAVVDGVMMDKNTTLIVAMYAIPAVSASQPAPTDQQNEQMSATASASVGSLSQLEHSESFWDRLSRGIHTILPTTLLAFSLLGIATFAAVLAHLRRDSLPTNRRASLYRYHGLAKIAIVGIVFLGILLIQGGGMI